MLLTTTQIADATDDDLAEAFQALYLERERRAVLARTEREANSLASEYAKAVEAEAPIPAKSLPDAIGPGRRITWTDGNVWRNSSGAWLPKTATPAAFPQGWAQETGLPASIPAWEPGEAVKVGDLRTHAGAIYRVVQAHTTQAGWEPPATPALWTEQG